MKRHLIYLGLLAVILISCGGRKSADYDVLKAENDSLKNVKQQLELEVNDYFATMNQIQQSISNVKSAENIITIPSVGQEMDEDARTKIAEDINYLAELLKTNRDELDKLRSRVKNSSLELGEVENTIKSLTKALEEETAKVADLQSKLAEKEEIIKNFTYTVEQMERDIEDLVVSNEEKSQQIVQQDESLYAAWYVFGTNKELKDQKIVTGGGLFSKKRVLENENFNRDYFVRIDYRKTRTIPLFSSKADILTIHPESSYVLEKENGQFILQITNPEQFWSISRYLVVEVD